MENDYPFTWFDELTELKWNPSQENFRMPAARELSATTSDFGRQADHILYSLKRKLFSVFDPNQKTSAVHAYLESISLLREQALQNQAHAPRQADLAAANEKLLGTLEDLQDRIQMRYAGLLSQSGAYPTSAERAAFKVLVRLSVDQIAIILKAADDLKILASRSLSLVFRRIIPFVSTERFTDISWKSARSSTYKMEDSDKASVVAILERLIRQIENY